MPDEPDDLVLQLLRTMRAENSARFDEIEAVLHDVRPDRGASRPALRCFGGAGRNDPRGTVSAIGFAANASRAHVDLRRQIADLTRRVERLEAHR